MYSACIAPADLEVQGEAGTPFFLKDQSSPEGPLHRPHFRQAGGCIWALSPSHTGLGVQMLQPNPFMGPAQASPNLPFTHNVQWLQLVCHPTLPPLPVPQAAQGYTSDRSAGRTVSACCVSAPRPSTSSKRPPASRQHSEALQEHLESEAETEKGNLLPREQNPESKKPEHRKASLRGWKTSDGRGEKTKYPEGGVRGKTGGPAVVWGKRDTLGDLEGIVEGT